MPLELVDREGLIRLVNKLGFELGDRMLAHAVKALGLREKESRPLPAPLKGRTKHYYRDAALTIAAAIRSNVSDDRVAGINGLERYRLLWDDIEASDLRHKTVFIPGWADREFAAQILFAFSLEHGPDPRDLADFLAADSERLCISSWGSGFLVDVLDSYLAASGDLLTETRRLLTFDMADKERLFTDAFALHLGRKCEIEAQIEGR